MDFIVKIWVFFEKRMTFTTQNLKGKGRIKKKKFGKLLPKLQGKMIYRIKKRKTWISLKFEKINTIIQKQVYQSQIAVSDIYDFA